MELVFVGVEILQVRFNLFGQKKNKLLIVSNKKETKESSILMHIDLETVTASIDHFFYMDGEIDKKILFQTFISCPENMKAEVEKSFVEMTMDVLLHIALFYKCDFAILFDVSKKNGYSLCNDIYRKPDYLNYYSRHYGFIHSLELNHLLDTVSMIDLLNSFHLTSMTDALKLATKEQLQNSQDAKEHYGKVHKPLEYIVSRYYAFFKHEKKTIPSTPLPNCSGYMIKYMDPIKNQWISYNRKRNFFFIEQLQTKMSFSNQILTLHN